jgi:hypothetical protein
MVQDQAARDVKKYWLQSCNFNARNIKNSRKKEITHQSIQHERRFFFSIESVGGEEKVE